MAPFPEAEIMTIKRLEVALRKMDFKLLKDGAYKLHEKYHSGHKFEYLDLLRDIMIEISNNPSVPEDIKNILCSTIEDILAQDNFIQNDSISYSDNNYQEKQVSTLTSLSYNIPQEESTISKEEMAIITDEPIETDYNIEKKDFEFVEENKEFQQESKINAFDAFSPQKTQFNQTQEQPQRFFTQSPFSAEPFKEFNHPTQISTTIEEVETMQTSTPLSIEPTSAPIYIDTPTQPIQQEITQTPTQIQYQETEIIAQAQDKKSIAILYCQDNSNEKIKNILKLREIISSSREKTASIDDLMALISEITTQANTNVIELQGILKQINSKGSKTALVTNSQSEMLTELLDSLELKYDLYKNNEEDKMNLIPLYGLSNLFYCSECGQTHLDKSSEVKPLVLECPQCKNPMYVDFWAPIENAHLNLEYYNKGLINLANSKVWLVIHPSFADKTTSKLIESALRISSNVEEIYVLDKDINTRENYKNFISKIKENVKVNAHNNTLEEFFNAI